jgi:phosphatase NudJ
MAEVVTSTLVSLVVVTKDERQKEFISVQERDGWYLPAGRVDHGETFATAAVRETLEEAGARVVLDGVLRVETAFTPRYARVRVVFAGHPADAAAPLKNVPDAETIQARWLTTAEMKTLRLRAREALRMFVWREQGAVVHPLSVVRGTDAPTVLHERASVPCLFLVAIAARSAQSGGGLVLATAATSELPTLPIHPHPSAHGAAAAACQQHALALGGFLGVSYRPPDRFGDQGTAVFVFAADAASELRGGLAWCRAREVVGPDGGAVDIAAEYAEGTLAPSDCLVSEGDPYT